MKALYIKICLITALSMGASGCERFIKVDAPVTSVNSGNVYENDNTAISVLSGMYANMNGEGRIAGMSLLPELSADNLILYDLNQDSYRAFFQNDLSAIFEASNPFFWNISYQQIYVANAAIEGITASSTLSPKVKKQLMGEALFMRAFYFFYLVNLYGDVPLILKTDYKQNSSISRTPEDQVYEQIISDLKEAQKLLADDYRDITLLNKTEERIRPSKTAATAMLARTYLYAGDYLNAELQADKVIENPIFSLLPLDRVFLKNSEETIWAIQPVQANLNTFEGWLFPLPNTGPDSSFPFYLSDHLLNSFESGDQRLNKWTGKVLEDNIQYYYPHKYKAGVGTVNLLEYTIVLRLAEQYLIRAEARAQQGNLIDAISDTDIIRARAGLPLIRDINPGIGQATLLDMILHERQVELFTEWGHRWLDLKRTGKIDEVMALVGPLKGGTWESYKALYPILQSEIDKNPGMIGQQNPGYN